jgi:hypothetical protein
MKVGIPQMAGRNLLGSRTVLRTEGGPLTEKEHAA